MGKGLKMLLCLMVILTCFVSNTGIYAADSNELKNHWAERVLTDWLSRNLIKGYEDGTVRPNHVVSRIEFAVLVNRQMRYTKTTSINFKDVAVNSWMYKDVSKAVANGYLTGYSDYTFKPYSSMSRLDAAIAIAKVLGLKDENSAILNQFKDQVKIPVWAQGKVSAIVSKGIMTGTPDKYFNPYGSLSRAEMIVVLDRAIGPDGLADKLYENARIGNTSANSYNQNGPVIKGGYLYDISDYFKRTKLDAAKISVFSFTEQLNVTDRYVFYVKGNRVLRHNLDGSGQKTILQDNYILEMQVFEDYVYFVNPKDGYKLNRMNLDGSDIKSISDSNAVNVNITKDYIYYKEINDSTRGGYLYRINKDGSGKKLISKHKGDSIVVWGSSIYFTDMENDFKICRIGLDGFGYRVLNDDYSTNLNIYQNRIYYSNQDDKGKLYSIKTGGTGRQKVSDVPARNITISAGKLFWHNEDDGWRSMDLPVKDVVSNNFYTKLGNRAGFINQQGSFLYTIGPNRYDLHGKNKLRLAIHEFETYEDVTLINIQNEWLYYATDKVYHTANFTHGKIYKVRADGSGEQTEVVNKTASEFVIDGEWIYMVYQTDYKHYSKVGLLYKVRTDGTGEGFINQAASIVVKNISVVDGWIYFINISDNNKIYKIRTDGTQLTKIWDQPSNQLFATKDRLYFDVPIDKTPYGDFWSMSLEGEDPKPVGLRFGRNLHVGKNKIVYAQNHEILTANLDGSNEKVIAKLYDTMGMWDFELQVSGEFVYFYDRLFGRMDAPDNGLFRAPIPDTSGYTFDILRQVRME